MRWLVTGGCGFIGRNLVRRLLQQPEVAIHVVDDLSVGTREHLGRIAPFVERGPTKPVGKTAEKRLELIVGDIRDEDLARRVTAGMDVVVHLAANTGVAPSIADPLRDCTTNVIGTLLYLEACRRNDVPRFVFASSGAPIGNCEPPLHEELPAHPVSPYGASKLSGEAYCSAYKRIFGIDTVALRFGNCYGPLSSHKSSIVAKFIREALAGQPWEIYGDGQQTRDYIYVDDVIEAILLSASVKNIGGEVFQIATNAETSVLDLAEKLTATLKRRGLTLGQMQHGAARIGDVKRNFSDTRKARERLGWTARVSLKKGLDRTVAWFIKEDARPAQRVERKD
jgi:UDP-glucose 4-epimerase